MLRQEQNELICPDRPRHADGPAFPAATGRQHCWPRNCPPTTARRCASSSCRERLVAFRDSEGRYGLIDEFCAHRGVSLWFGRNEECGLRCPYHGWKFDFTGQCIEVPSEPVESGFAKKIKLKSYPLVERGGILWTYMGPPEHQPPLPEWEFATVPAAQRFISKRFQESNWLQAMEGGIDSSHVSWLHRDNINRDPAVQGRQGQPVQYGRHDARCSRWSKAPAVSTSARAAMPRRASTTGASPNGSCRPSP